MVVVKPLTCVWLFVTPGTAAARLFCPPRPLRVCSDSCPLSLWCYLTILLPSIFPRIRVFSNESALCLRWPKCWSFSLGISPSSDYWVDFLWNRLVWCPCCPRDSQESSPAPQFESIHSSALSLLYDPTLTSVHNYWKTKVWTLWIFVSKAMTLTFNTLSRFVIPFLRGASVF